MKSYSSYGYSSGYEKYTNDYSKYGSIFREENPYKRKSISLSSKAIGAIAQGRVDTANEWKTTMAAPIDRSLFDRSIDTLMTANYMSAGFADGALKNAQGKANFFQPWKQAAQGFMAGVGGVFGDGNEEHEYTYSRVIETAGWSPDSTFGKVVKGTIGFVGDVLLDPTTYMTFGVSAALKGTGRVGKAAQALDDVVKKVPDMEVFNRTQSLISKGVSPERAASGAAKLVAKNASKYQNVTEMTSEMAENMLKYDAFQTGTKLTAQELARDATNFSKQFNKSIGIRNYNRDVSIGVRNLPFVGDKLANKMGAAGKTVKIADGDTIRAWSDKLGVAKKYSDVRFSIYGGQIGKLLSTNSPKVNWALKDPVQMYKIVSASEKLMGKDLDKVSRKKEITDMARAMNLEPFEQREVIKFLENKTNMHKVRTILRVGETQSAKVYEQMAGDMRPDELKMYDELEQQHKSIKQLEQDMQAYKAGSGKYAPENVSIAKQEVENVRTGHNVLNKELDELEADYVFKYDKYVAQLARVDMKKVTDVSEREFLVKSLDEEITRLTGSNKDISKQLRKVRDDATKVGPRNDADIMQNVAKVEAEYRQKDIKIVSEIRELSKTKYKEDTFVQDKLKSLKVEREDLARNLRIVDKGTPEPYPFDYNPHTPNLQHINSIRVNMDAVKTIKPEPVKMDGSFDDLLTKKQYEISDSMSHYIFGRSGMIETIKDPQIMQDILLLMEKGHSPSYIQNIPMIHNDRFLTPRASSMYKLVAEKLGYKNYSKEHLSKLKSLESKAYMNLPKNMSAGALTDVEKGRFDYLSAQRKQAVMTDEMNKEFKSIVKKMQLQRDYDGVNPGNFNFKRLEPEEMQEYLRLKKLDEERDALIRTYSNMSDSEFQRFATFEKTTRQADDLMVMAHGDDGGWGLMDTAGDVEKGFINPEIFYDDVMREMRTMARALNPTEQQKFFKNVMDKITEGTTYVNPTLIKDTPAAYSLIQSAHTNLIKKFGGRAYDDLTAAEQKVFLRATLEGALNPASASTYWRAIAVNARKQKQADALVSRHETIRENVWEGHVVNINKDAGVVMARRDLETGTEYDVLMANGKTFTVSPDEITSIARGKRYDPQSVADSAFVQKSLGTKKELIARINAIDKQVDALAGKKLDTALPNVQKMKIQELEQVRAGLMGKMSDELEVYAKQEVPTKSAVKAQQKMQKLEGTRKDNRKALVKLRAKREAELKLVGSVDEQVTQELMQTTRAFEDNVVAPYNAEKTRLNAMKEDLQKNLEKYEANVAEYTLNMNKYTDAIDDLGGKTTIDEFEAMSVKLAEYQQQFKNMDVLEDFMRVQIEKTGVDFDRWAKHTIDEESGLNAILKTIDDSSLNDKQKAWAGLVREFFFRAGVDEVRIGKLKPEQFEAMASTYVYHHATPEFLEYKAVLDRALGHTSPTQDYGYGVKWSGTSKERTQHEDILSFNETMKDTLKGKNAFSEDLAEVFLARMLKHEELMYDNKQMNTFAERFGQAYKYGDEVEDGFNVFGNFGKIREMLVEQTNMRFKENIKTLARERGGGEITEAERKLLWEKGLDEILPRYGFHSRDIMDGKTLPMLELTDEQRKLLSPSGLAYKMNTAIGDAANNSRKIKMARDENELMQVYDKFQHFIKLHQTALMPGFHVKNKYSNLFQSWLGVGRDAVNVKIHSAAQKAVFHKGDVNKLKDMKPLVSDDGTQVFHWHDMYAKAVNWGVIDEGYFAQDLSKMTESTGLLKGIVPGKFDPTSTRDFVPYKFATNVGSHVENGDRLVHFASMLKQGHSVDDAADSVAKHLFDYSDLTPFERTVMKRIFPYYTWIRKNGRLQTSALIEQPEKFLMVAKVHSGIEGMSNEEDRIDRALLPDFAKDWIKTPFMTTNAQGQKIPMMLSPNMPYMDLARLPDIFNPVDSAREWFGMSSPLLKVPLELAANYNSFFNENIVKTDEENPDDNTKHPALARLNHVAGQLGWYSAARNITTSKGTTQGFHVLNTLAGVKFMNHNEAFAREQMMKGLYEGNSDLGRAITGFTEEIRTRISNKVYLMQGAMAETLENAAVALTGAPPLHAEDYTGALAPISKVSYDELSKEERAKYAPPSKEDAAVYAKEALRLQEEAYAETGLIKQFVWSLFDETDQVADKEVVRVTEVADGDTFTADNGSGPFNLRLLMVDTPETVDPDMSGPMPFGKEASDYSKTMLLGKDVTVQISGKDVYNRTLAYIELDGNDYNKMLIEEGLGKMRYLDGTTDYTRYNDYRDAEKKAAKQKQGLWSIDEYAKPGVDEGYNWGE